MAKCATQFSNAPSTKITWFIFINIEHAASWYIWDIRIRVSIESTTGQASLGRKSSRNFKGEKGLHNQCATIQLDFGIVNKRYNICGIYSQR